MALLSRRPRSATVVTKTPARLLVLERERFNDLVQREPTLACKFLFKLAQTLSTRLGDCNEVVDENAARQTKEMAVLSPFRRL